MIYNVWVINIVLWDDLVSQNTTPCWLLIATIFSKIGAPKSPKRLAFVIRAEEMWKIASLFFPDYVKKYMSVLLSVSVSAICVSQAPFTSI